MHGLRHAAGRLCAHWIKPACNHGHRSKHLGCRSVGVTDNNNIFRASLDCPALRHECKRALLQRPSPTAFQSRSRSLLFEATMTSVHSG
jgi:hypothetical protein